MQHCKEMWEQANKIPTRYPYKVLGLHHTVSSLITHHTSHAFEPVWAVDCGCTNAASQWDEISNFLTWHSLCGIPIHIRTVLVSLQEASANGIPRVCITGCGRPVHHPNDGFPSKQRELQCPSIGHGDALPTPFSAGILAEMFDRIEMFQHLFHCILHEITHCENM